MMKGAIFATFCLALLGGFVHAEKECTPLTEAAAANTILLQAVEAAGLTDLLTADDASFTIFAPTDEAFTDVLTKLDITAEELLGMPEVLGEILKFHVLAEPKMAADLGTGGTFPTALTEASCDTTDLVVEVDDDGVTVGGGLTEATVTTADVEACADTVIHVIDTVLVPCPLKLGGDSAGGSGGSSSGGSK
ncbi:hypothetical protein BSKO_11725 [Bryopsis sp. KO-2023]|nr:hypothetical protein BSKO_11725 [Bryopsis sp. KO-2023]